MHGYPSQLHPKFLLFLNPRQAAAPVFVSETFKPVQSCNTR